MPPQTAAVICYGADFFTPFDFSSLYGLDSLYFDGSTAADTTIDYAQWLNRRRVPFLELYVNLVGYGAAKQLALIFGFSIPNSGSPGRVLVYTDAGQISDQTLGPGESQFLLEIDSLDSPFFLYFIHAGDSWLFTGLSGYVV
jgi:hypothetical protein